MGTKPYEVVADSREREEWLQMRNTGIGGSEMAAVLGLTKRRSALDVYAVKIGATEEKDLSGEPYIEIGHELEPVIQRLFEKRTGLETQPHGLLLRSREYPWAIVTPDFTVLNGGVIPLEAKSTGKGMVKDWADGLPSYYVPQVQMQMLVMETDHAYAAVLTADPTWDFAWTKVDRDEALLADIIQAGERFWDCVVRKETPDIIDGSESCSKALAALFRVKATEEFIPFPPEAVDLDEELERVKASVKAGKKRKGEIENRLKLWIGDNKGGILPDGTKYTHSRSEIAAGVVKRKAHTRSVLNRKEAS